MGLAARSPPRLRLGTAQILRPIGPRAAPAIARSGATASGLVRSYPEQNGGEWSDMSDQDRDKPKLNPGDQAPPGTPGTGENICPDCAGSGKVDAQPCPTCGGTGKVVEGVGGG
jgi:hypothetical protein